jgi:glucose-1-phosphate adenylyltransferase
VLFPGVEIARGATIVDSVVLPGARIGAGSRLRGVIVEGAFRVPDGAVIERSGAGSEPLVLSQYGHIAQYALAG